MTTATTSAAMGMLATGMVPMAVMTDSYKATHPFQYPEARKMVAYGEFRAAFNKDKTDNRFVSYGMRYLVETYLHRQWTEQDVQMAEAFYATHNAGHTKYPYPKELFLKFIRENDGYFPVRIEALLDGTCAHVHVPVYQITAEGEYARLVTFLETMLTQVWYPATVATLSRRTRDLVDRAFEHSVDAAQAPLAAFKLHDFGFRGCTSLEQAIIGGCAHLLNFRGTDTMSAAFYAQFHLNGGRPVAESIPATEHSVMTAWPSEKAAIDNMLHHFGDGTYSIVMDSYDYTNALDVVLPAVADAKRARGGHMVLRPDSGDPVQVVLQGLRAADKAFGHTVNGKGFRVLNNISVIQGDGINIDTAAAIIAAVHEAGYSAQNVTFGMGGGLLQKVNRDTMSFATKLSYIVDTDGTCRDVMKAPKTDATKFSLPGVLKVLRVDGVPTVFPVADGEDATNHPDNLLRVIYDRRPVAPALWESFDQMRDRVAAEWSRLPKLHDPISKEMRDKIAAWRAKHLRT